ncbi:MAG: septation regulator SpoVG [Pseudomonadota bacterium]|nr:septation regulator SpoVG [Pseudomonadota bacterium]
MKVTDVKIVPVDEDRLKGYVTVTIDDCFVIRDIKIIQGHDGLFVAMPSKKKKDGTYRDIAHPVNQETRQIFEKQIFDAYEKMVAEQSPPQNETE